MPSPPPPLLEKERRAAPLPGSSVLPSLPSSPALLPARQKGERILPCSREKGEQKPSPPAHCQGRRSTDCKGRRSTVRGSALRHPSAWRPPALRQRGETSPLAPLFVKERGEQKPALPLPAQAGRGPQAPQRQGLACRKRGQEAKPVPSCSDYPPCAAQGRRSRSAAGQRSLPASPGC